MQLASRFHLLRLRENPPRPLPRPTLPLRGRVFNAKTRNNLMGYRGEHENP